MSTGLGSKWTLDRRFGYNYFHKVSRLKFKYIKLFSCSGCSAAHLSISGHSWAIIFFSKYANDMHEYRVHLLSSTGIPLSVEYMIFLHAETGTNRKNRDIRYLCHTFARLSEFDWCVSILLQCDICSTLVSLLMYVSNDILCSYQSPISL